MLFNQDSLFTLKESYIDDDGYFRLVLEEFYD